MSLLDWLRNTVVGGVPGPRLSSLPLEYPPPNVKAEWERIDAYVRRYDNDLAEMLRHDPTYKGAADEEKSTYTPVPLAQEMARLSSALLFSAEPKLTSETKPEVLERIVEANAPGELLLECGEYTAIQGYIGIRLIRDAQVSDEPLLTWVPANRVIWRTRHGRFVTGGYVVIERRPNPFTDEVYRLVEDHKPGSIERALYKGTKTTLGATVAHRSWLEEFSGLPERTNTRLEAPTLYRWNNVPRGVSDLHGLDTLFDRLNEGESVGVEKLRRSVPITMADRKLADRQGRVNLRGVILTGSTSQIAGDGVAKTIETVQRSIESEDHVRYVEHVREVILQMAGYSLATWGLGDGGTADSGTALRLRQARTLLTKAGKERSARRAIVSAFAAAGAWAEGARDPKEYRPEILLGDGLPTDPLQDAQELATLRGAELVSIEQGVRELHPDWPDDQVEAETKRIAKESAPPQVSTEPFRPGRNVDPEEEE